MKRVLNQLYWIELVLSVSLIQAIPVYAQSSTGVSSFTAPPPPVDIGEPGQRSGAGSRRTCGEQAVSGKGLTALVPLRSCKGITFTTDFVARWCNSILRETHEGQHKLMLVLCQRL